MSGWALAVALLVLAPAAGAPTNPTETVDAGFTLADALEAMREGHPRLGFASARRAAADASTVAARLWDNPVVGVDYVLGVRSTSYDRVGTFVVGVGQWLPVTAVPRVRQSVARHEARVVEADNERMVRALELRVERAMLALAAALRAVEIRREAEVDLAESRRIVEARVAAGVAPQYDATRMALAAAEAEAAVHSAAATVTEARGELAVAVGPLADRLRGAPQIDLFTPPDLLPLEALRVRMLERRPDLAAARARSESARASVTLARRAVFPGIGLRVVAGFGQGPGQIDVGAGLSVPLPVLSRGQGLIDRARAETWAAEHIARGLAVAADQRLRAAYEATLQRRAVSLRHVRLSAGASDALRRQAEAGYQNGRLSVLELADASFSVRDMRLRDLELARAARLAEIELRRVVLVETNGGDGADM